MFIEGEKSHDQGFDYERDGEKFSLPEILKPDQSALLVIDMQNDFLSEGGFFDRNKNQVGGGDISAMQATIPHINHLVNAAHLARVPVIYTIGYEDVKFRRGPGLRRAVKWQERDGDGSVNSQSGTWGAELHPEIKPDPEKGDIVLEKHKWTAFSGKDKDGKTLDQILEEKRIKTLVITGVVTETCVHATIQGAYNDEREYFVVVPKDCVGSNIPVQHQTVTDHSEGFFGDVLERGEEIEQYWPPVKEEASETHSSD